MGNSNVAVEQVQETGPEQLQLGVPAVGVGAGNMSDIGPPGPCDLDRFTNPFVCLRVFQLHRQPLDG